MGCPPLFHTKNHITMKTRLFLFFFIIPFLGNAQFSAAAYVGGIYQDRTDGLKYNLEASIYKYSGDYRIEARYGNLANEHYVGLSIGEDINNFLLFMISADYYLEGVTEHGLPKVYGMSSEVRYTPIRSDVFDLSISARWGFHTSKVFGMLGIKITTPCHARK